MNIIHKNEIKSSEIMGKLNKPIEREFINKNLILNKKMELLHGKIHQEQLSQINELMIEKVRVSKI